MPYMAEWYIRRRRFQDAATLGIHRFGLRFSIDRTDLFFSGQKRCIGVPLTVRCQVVVGR